MIAAMFWKEYRQQRTIWLAIVVLLVVPALGLVGFVAPGRFWQEMAAGDFEGLASVLAFAMVCVMVVYGVVCGALLLAGEKEENTLVFLDMLPAWRFTLWRTKLVAGLVLTIGQGLLLTAFVLGLNREHWRQVVMLPALAMDAMIWGLLGGALCRNVLVASLIGSAFMVGSWSVLMFEAAVTVVLLKVLLTALAALGSAWLFCKSDRARIRWAREQFPSLVGPEKRAPAAVRARRLVPAGWRALAWLTVRQGRWILLGTLVACVVLGPFVNLAPMLFYPVGTLLVGLVCGLAVFIPEQSGRRQSFLGAQRFPPGQVWAIKVGFWALTAIILTALFWAVAVGTLILKDAQALKYTGQESYWLQQWWGGPTGDTSLFLGLWAIYGFCLGQFLGLWAPHPISAAILATLLGVIVCAVWLPSVLFGGLALWQVLGAPLLLLLATRLFLWPWLAGRLHTFRPMLGMIALSLAAVLWLAGSIWYRVFEVPDVGEPFDIQEFVAGIPPPEKNEAAALIRQAAKEVEIYRKKLAETLPPPTNITFPAGAAVQEIESTPEPPRFYIDVAYEVLDKGWPEKEGEFPRWLELMFQGDWFKEIHRAARLPLGVLHDPRNDSILTNHDDLQNCRQIGLLLAVRAFELERNGDFTGALDHVETLLGLSRQLRNHSPAIPFLTGKSIESVALSVHHNWLEKLGPRTKLLKKALLVLKQHETLLPDPLDPVKAEYFIFQNTVRKFFDFRSLTGQTTSPNALRTELWAIAWQIPWERERQNRLTNALHQGGLRGRQKPYWETLEAIENGTVPRLKAQAAVAQELGLPPEEGPGARLSADQWGRLLRHSWARFAGISYALGRYYKLVQLRGELLVTALALYQAKNGKPALKLDDLVPRYLRFLPVDPYSGRPFQYRVSKGEKIEGQTLAGQKETTLLEGQGLVWSDGDDSFRPVEARGAERRFLFLVPRWAEKR